MKKNNFIKKPKKHLIAILILFCGLFANEAVGQETFTWNGSTSTSWADTNNWTQSTPGVGDDYPGQSLANATVVIDKNDTPFAPNFTGIATITKLTVSNAFGSETGATLTIASGTLNVIAANTTVVILSGGSIVNNGTLNITASVTAASFGIQCTTPTVAPTAAREYGYSGNGTLNVNISASTSANSAAVNINSLNANTTYKMLFNEATTTFTLSSSTTVTSFAIRMVGGASASPIIVGGTGFTLGSAGSPINGGLLSLGAQSTTTVNAGTKLTLYSASTNPSRQISSFSSAAVATTFTNKGIINILGASKTSGLFFSTGTTANTVVFTINNEGTINIDLNCSGIGTAPLSNGNGGGRATGVGTGFFINNTGTISLKNPATATGTGNAIFGSFTGEAPPLNITNSGTISFEGSINNSGSKTTITNNGIINSNNDFISFGAITNSPTGTFNFVRTAATSTNKQVAFTVASNALASTNATYTDGTNTFNIVSQKFSFALPNPLVTNVLSGASITATGTLTKLTGTGDASIAYTGISTSLENSAFTAAITNSGTINTDTASNLNVISGVTTTSTSVIAPGGAAGKGITSFTGATKTILGKLIMQVDGNTAAGVDYDQITNLTVDGGFDITGATLDLTGLSGTATPVDIILANGAGTITGEFASVIGLTSGWSVDYSDPSKVQLVYSATSPNANTWTGATDTSWTDASNWSAGVPDQNSDVTIAAAANQPTIATNVNINSLTIASGATLSVTANNLTVTGAIANSGTMTIESNANLIQGGTTNTNTGNITVKRNSNALYRSDYTIWSSPVTNTGLFLKAFSPLTVDTRFYNYNETTNKYNTVVGPSTTPFATATGYLIRMPNNGSTAYEAGTETLTYAAEFTGIPNNGDITKAMGYDGVLFGYNMVGNPYPSTINADAFITANTANIENSLYFWRKINAASGSAYAVYNPLGGTTASPSSDLPNGIIQVGQGFFVKAKSASNLTFTNAMRVANNANQFFKTKEVQKDRLWLNLTTTSGIFSQTLVGYTAAASQGLDIFDAKYFNDSPIALTSNINNEEYTIQGRPAFDPSDIVALNFKTDAAGDYTISLDHFDGVFAAGQDIFLKDNTTGAETNLKNSSYTFNAASGTYNTRFSLTFQKTLKVGAPAFNENSVSVYNNNGTLYVNSGSVAMSNISVFDVQGRLISEQRNVKATTATIKDVRSNQVLIVKIVGEDNAEVTKKVIN